MAGSAGTLGRRVARLSASLGRPFMPWQRTASNMLNEVDAAGRRLRPFSVVTVQRQAGKTAWIQAECTDRGLFDGPARRIWYTAQSGHYATEKWTEVATALCAPTSPLAGYITVRWSRGSECLTFPNGSTFRPFPPTKDALHGVQSDFVIIDEGWAHDATRGAELLQAISPTQATRPNPQVVILSAMGTADSTFLHGLVDRGRAGDPGLAYLEYGIGPEGDPSDLDAVVAAHPAVGHTITADYVRSQLPILGPSEFARAYGNARTAVETRFIDAGLWHDAATDEPLPDELVPVFAAEVAQDQSRTAIVAAAGGVLEVIDSRPGTLWAVDALLSLAELWRPPAVAVAATGPSAALFDALATYRRQAGRPAALRTGVLVDAGKFANVAPQRFMDRLVLPAGAADALRHRRHVNLDAAADAAVPRSVADGWTWGRRQAGGPIPEIVAATNAAWMDQHRPARPRPLVVSAAS